MGLFCTSAEVLWACVPGFHRVGSTCKTPPDVDPGDGPGVGGLVVTAERRHQAAAFEHASLLQGTV